MNLIRRVTRILAADTGQSADAPGSGSGESAGLFRCARCETTYICREMETCPDCQKDVESIPTESDLGMV